MVALLVGPASHSKQLRNGAFDLKRNFQKANSAEISAKSSILKDAVSAATSSPDYSQNLLARSKYPLDTIVVLVALFRWAPDVMRVVTK
jgi:hypothetical protein